jgi:tRNA-dihydrouridine synthase 1
VYSVISTLAKGLRIPVTCKVRVFADYNKTLQYVTGLQNAGASLITIHGRQRHQKEEVLADWSIIAKLRMVCGMMFLFVKLISTIATSC